MCTSSDFGVSMIVAPAYILSLKIEGLSFGYSEYIVQGLLFIAFCIVMKKFRWVYLMSFVTSLLYGRLLDFWMTVIPHFNPSVYATGSLPLPLRIVYLAGGMVLTSFAVALFFRTYICPQVYDYFVKKVTEKYGFNRVKFKYIYDGICLLTACCMTLVFFHGFKGIGIGTVIMTICNSFLINASGKFIDRFLEIKPAWPKTADWFEK